GRRGRTSRAAGTDRTAGGFARVMIARSIELREVGGPGEEQDRLGDEELLEVLVGVERGDEWLEERARVAGWLEPAKRGRTADAKVRAAELLDEPRPRRGIMELGERARRRSLPVGVLEQLAQLRRDLGVLGVAERDRGFGLLVGRLGVVANLVERLERL